MLIQIQDEDGEYTYGYIKVTGTLLDIDEDECENIWVSEHDCYSDNECICRMRLLNDRTLKKYSNRQLIEELERRIENNK